ncbi:hypothetical protein N0V95_003663, partial [Ascochyta clinopodiicola]
ATPTSPATNPAIAPATPASPTTASKDADPATRATREKVTPKNVPTAPAPTATTAGPATLAPSQETDGMAGLAVAVPRGATTAIIAEGETSAMPATFTGGG